MGCREFWGDVYGYSFDYCLSCICRLLYSKFILKSCGRKVCK